MMVYPLPWGERVRVRGTRGRKSLGNSVLFFFIRELFQRNS
jgi:hypothetical protein